MGGYASEPCTQVFRLRPLLSVADIIIIFFLSCSPNPFPTPLPAQQRGCCSTVSFIFVNTLSGLGNQIVSFKFNLNFCLKNQPETSKGIQKMHYKINDQMTSENIALLYLEILDQNSNFFYC